MTTNPIQWGQQRTYAEPSPGVGLINDGYVSLTPAVVVGGQRGREIPEARDWTIYVQVSTDSPTRLFAPFVNVTVRYGSGSSAFTRQQRVPVMGCVMHVVATWLDVECSLQPTGIAGDGNVTISAYASPGRPATQRIQQADFQLLSPLTYAVPPFASALLATESDNGGVVVLPAVWQYNGINRGVVSPAVLPVWSQAAAVPQDASSVRVFPTRPNLNLFWEVQS